MEYFAFSPQTLLASALMYELDAVTDLLVDGFRSC